jgi:YVTN family beta-propeller protein
VINPRTNTISKTLQAGDADRGLALHPSDTLLYVASRNTGQIFVVSTKRDVVLGGWVVGGVPQRLAVSRAGDELYVANEDGQSPRVDVVNTRTGAVIRRIPLLSGGYGLARSPDDKQVYVSMPAAGRVAVIDRATRTQVRTIVTGGAPRNIAFDRVGTTAAIANEAGWVDFVQ